MRIMSFTNEEITPKHDRHADINMIYKGVLFRRGSDIVDDLEKFYKNEIDKE